VDSHEARLFTPALTHDVPLLVCSCQSLVAKAMLSRAVKSFEPPVPRRDRAAVAAPSSSPKSSLDGFLQSPRPASQKTLGGYTGLINKRAVGGYARPNLPSGPISTRPPASSGYNRTSSDMSGLAATLNKPDAFKEPACVVDLTQETTAPVVSSHITNVQFEFNPDDFDDDSDIDLDFEYPQSLPTLDTKREPLTTVPVNTVPSATLAVSEEDVSNKLQYPTSTWSSSPVSHKMAPPAALRRQQCDNPLVPMAPPSSVDPEPPRPAKRRRMLPWMPQQAIEPSPAETSESSRPTSREDSHQGASVQTPPRVSKTHAFLDATESVMKAQQKAFKDQQRKVKKGSALPAGEMQDVKRTTNQDLYRPICLTDEQRKVENLVVNEKKSVFFTGSAGTGKSVLMRSIIASLRKVYARETDRVAVTASTGLAACNIGGVTLHSFAGIGLGKGTVEELAKKVNTNQKARTRWIRTKILIVDEVSMLDGDLFDKLEAVAKKVRKNGRPFGGIQLVITGDFFQLPPVPDGGNRAVKFCFDAATWPTVIHHTILLTEVFRQRDPGLYHAPNN
jgi:ATP-dependent DNA helicase PIF1